MYTTIYILFCCCCYYYCSLFPYHFLLSSLSLLLCFFVIFFPLKNIIRNKQTQLTSNEPMTKSVLLSHIRTTMKDQLRCYDGPSNEDTLIDEQRSTSCYIEAGWLMQSIFCSMKKTQSSDLFHRVRKTCLSSGQQKQRYTGFCSGKSALSRDFS